MTTDVDSTFQVGQETAFDSIAPGGQYGVLFEDDGIEGLFHAIDVGSGQQLLDTLHLYDADRGPDRTRPCRVRIMWSANGLAAAIALNENYYALFDFVARGGYCHSGKPDNGTGWARVRQRSLTPEIVRMFF
ncbi:DUF2251 domain-containing protein [Flaviaesturariibacter amylovorans]|uniref:DUF2251 domain-containing protein n=1 Tax=Flaviaesturariibacter amylovorans TaxID=1084520 RepID=A0ABP8HUJ4_9BACT